MWYNSSYMGWDEKGTFYIASELKALEDIVIMLRYFPGHYYFSEEGKLNKWYDRKWDKINLIDNEKKTAEVLRISLERQYINN